MKGKFSILTATIFIAVATTSLFHDASTPVPQPRPPAVAAPSVGIERVSSPTAGFGITARGCRAAPQADDPERPHPNGETIASRPGAASCTIIG